MYIEFSSLPGMEEEEEREKKISRKIPFSSFFTVTKEKNKYFLFFIFPVKSDNTSSAFHYYALLF